MPSKEKHVSEDAQASYEASLGKYLNGKITRARMLATAGVGLGVALAPGVVGAQTPTVEATADILNIADTAEHLAVTLLTAAVGNKSQLGLSGPILAVVQAALAEEQYHADFLESNGAKPLTDTFTIPNPAILTDPTTFFKTVEAAETIFVGAYMAATREFSMMGNPTLAQYAYQIGTVEAEHRVLARAALALAGHAEDIPPNNLGFEQDVVYYVKDAAAILTNLGFIGGTGTQATYPGRAAALAAAAPTAGMVIQTTP